MNLGDRFKRTAFILALGAVAFSGQARAASATASANAAVIAPIAVNKTSDLSFGRFSSGAGGTITVSTSGERSASGVIPSADGGAMTAAEFVVSGDKNASYSIAHGGTAALLHSAGADTMMLTKFSDLSGANASAGNVLSGKLISGTQTIHVGGTLAVAANQAPGDYAGVVTVTVEYH